MRLEADPEVELYVRGGIGGGALDEVEAEDIEEEDCAAREPEETALNEELLEFEFVFEVSDIVRTDEVTVADAENGSSDEEDIVRF